jgi:hypothetical protein
MTHLPAVRDARRAGAVYAEVLRGRVVMEENPCTIVVGQATGVVG